MLPPDYRPVLFLWRLIHWMCQCWYHHSIPSCASRITRLTLFQFPRLSHVPRLDYWYMKPHKSKWSSKNSSAKDSFGCSRPFSIDFWVLNEQTIGNFIPIPKTADLIDRTRGSKIFSSIDLWSAYHEIRNSEPVIPKTAFTSPFNRFEYPVVSFGQTKSEYEEHQNQVLQILPDHHLHAKSFQFHFFQDRIEFLGQILTPDGVSSSQSKLEAINTLPASKVSKLCKGSLDWMNQ